MLKRKPKILTPEQVEEIRTKDFFDMILPGTIRFLSDHYIVGDSYRCVWAVREYPPSTEEQAILSQLADRSGVTLRIYHRLVESMEQRKIIQNATRRNRLKSGGNDVSESIEAEGNLQDVIELLANLRKNKEPLLHCSVFIELKAKSMEKLKELQSDITLPVESPYEPSAEVIRLNNEIGRMLDMAEIDKTVLRSKMTKCLARKYKELGNGCCAVQRLKAELDSTADIAERLNRTVSEIRLYTDKTADIILLNGQIIRKEQGHATDNGCPSESGADNRTDRIGQRKRENPLPSPAGGGILPRFH